MTYTLFIGGLSVEAVGLFSLIFSNWSIVALKNYNVVSSISKFHFFLFGGPRWSESIPQCNLIPMVLVEWSPKWMEKIVQSLLLKSLLDELQQRSRKPITDDLKLLIFAKLKEKSLHNIPPKNNGGRLNAKKNWTMVAKKFLEKTTSCILSNTCAEENFDESILVLHIATELCYHHNDGVVFFGPVGNTSSPKEREMCKILSDYMFKKTGG